ncbi:MAG TPA: signal peptidase II [Dissulfurispiraceae bacterium]|nr:signal peptidase II [Dissulfurispiraceae bacterium]
MKRASPFFLISFVILILDQITKHIIKTSLGPADVIPVLPFFSIVYVENTGSAFGMFKSLGNAFFVTLSFVAIAVVAFLVVKDEQNRLGLSLVLGGAAGNLVDRMRFGYVVDFLDFFAGSVHWPAFNVADSALTVGIILLLIATVRSGRKG